VIQFFQSASSAISGPGSNIIRRTLISNIPNVIEQLLLILKQELLETSNLLFSHGSIQKTAAERILRCRGNVFIEQLSIDNGGCIDRKVTRPRIIVARIRCRENVFTEPLPSEDKGMDMQAHPDETFL
jgi:hypothetical protein